MSGQDLTFVVVTDTAGTIGRLLAALRAQTVADRIELAIACRSEEELSLRPADVTGIGRVVVVPVPSLHPLEAAQAEAIRVTSAPIVLLGETHAFPSDTTIQHAIEAFEDAQVGAVSPHMRNGNPERQASWANFVISYGAMCADERREVPATTGHNAFYRRSVLPVGDELRPALTIGAGLDADVRARGFRIVYDPDVTFDHLNMTVLPATLRARFYFSRGYAAARARRWGRGRRAVYAAGSPAVPVILLIRTVRSEGFTSNRSRIGLGAAPTLLGSALAAGLGEACGYLRGAGRSREMMTGFEIWREPHI